MGYAEGDHFNASTYEMAFPLACVSVDLMTQHPGLKELFLGTLYGCGKKRKTVYLFFYKAHVCMVQEFLLLLLLLEFRV